MSYKYLRVFIIKYFYSGAAQRIKLRDLINFDHCVNILYVKFAKIDAIPQYAQNILNGSKLPSWCTS